ncbi:MULTISPECIES: (Fe-S)-binding protein [Streptomyces]|uniref:(Fe-S)-binding protein n=2 Tax=Streptomyces rimosus subsp. rimosus TaxID=132474 RepID=L8EUC4_STRR1|nr:MULTISPECIES: (Fe-S)-binding protein [Streptomyces]KOG70988.1 Fe-S oxidoreductase [Kitasatospora aureofaciens]MYT45557.1 (Fe-S)-binding protein [Streptomyces sp. SID5471]KEF08827.1 Fe-S osidoreductase [Streptomyces rimosus]KEF16983.1 Fe-S osidoreductase [Streptomyces rimosus]KUJ27563.1 Fe-S oxidoreductase [Streptomyces rimosus subsp. rimosus]
MRVALFVTCINDTLHPDTGRAVITLLERLGVEVGFPEEQSCCGQPQFNTGYRHLTEPLVRRYERAFRDYDYVVTPSGSCAAMVRDNYPRIAAEGRDSRDLAEAAARAVPKTYELTEFLVDVLKVTDVGAYYPHTVTYHPTCHGLRMLRLGDRPRRLLEHVKGLELRELPGAEECCGFGGTFAVKNPAVSAAMGADKVRAVRETGAEAVCTVDNSCLLHIGGMLRREGAAARPVHIAEILAATEADTRKPAGREGSPR